MVAMVEYILHGSGRSLQDLPDIDPAMLIGDMANTALVKESTRIITTKRAAASRGRGIRRKGHDILE